VIATPLAVSVVLTVAVPHLAAVENAANTLPVAQVALRAA